MRTLNSLNLWDMHRIAFSVQFNRVTNTNKTIKTNTPWVTATPMFIVQWVLIFT